MLTDRQVRQLKSSGRQIEIADRADVKGLTLRVNQADTKSFWLTFRAPENGKQARVRLGEYDEQHFTLAKARELGRYYRSLIDRGIDPRDYVKEEAERQKREREQTDRLDKERRANSFAAVVAEYVIKYQRAKKDNRTWRETERLLLVNCPEWHERPVAEIARRDVHSVLDRVMAAGKGYSANRTYAALKTFFRWCASRDVIASDPMQGVERPFDGEQVRDRAWSDAEVAGIWRAADIIGGNAGAALKLLILLGQRRDEVFHMRWSELEQGGTLWRLTKMRSKAKREHLFPLPALAQRITNSLPRRDECEYVFPTAGGRPIVSWTALKKRVQQLSGVADFTFHSARHTLRTALDGFGVRPHVKDECLNHARQGVGDRHYSHYDYVREQREAFEQWSAHVQSVVFGEKVTVLRG